MMRLFHSHGACSEGVLLLLQQIGAPFAVDLVDLKTRQQRSPAFLALNPKGKVPTLVRPDGTTLSEFPAIALWLAHAFPDARLIGPTLDDQIRAMELVEFIVSTLHMRGFTLVKVPMKFSSDPRVQAAIKAHGLQQAQNGLDHLSTLLGDQPFLLGAFSIADAAAWYVLRWALVEDVTLPDNLRALHDRIAARPAKGDATA